MEEAASDKQSSTSEPKRDKQRASGWIRMHSDEKKTPPLVDEVLDKEDQSEDQSRDRRIRKELAKS